MKRTLFFILSIFLLATNGCSINKIAVGVMDDILQNGVTAMSEESDVQLAKDAFPGNLKLLEALIKSDPENTDVLLMAAQGYGGYAIAFVEEEDPERASKLYLRGKKYALMALQQKNKSIYQSLEKPLADFENELMKAKKKDTPWLFWLAYNWISYINLNKTSVRAIGDLPKVLAIMERVIELDPGYYYGGAHLSLGAYYGSLPKMMGGDPEIAKNHFQKAMELTDHKFLLTKVYFAQFYARNVFDEELFDSLLNGVIEAPDDILPEQNLTNMIAKQRARRLLAQKEELF
ncbi:MAG: hypothetical protein B6244_12855 [Candidatus Cloacimonetes bacterium 4572_55]|nr:MAG: hypothetical protein B6244_12855 [Candidatus Cloacimonetes bacterium 4572_55]